LVIVSLIVWMMLVYGMFNESCMNLFLIVNEFGKM